VALWLRALSWVVDQATDGVVPRRVLWMLTRAENAAEVAAELVAVGLWDVEGDGWRFHDYGEHNITSLEWESQKEAHRARAKKARNAHSAHDVRAPCAQQDGEDARTVRARCAAQSDTKTPRHQDTKNGLEPSRVHAREDAAETADEPTSEAAAKLAQEWNHYRRGIGRSDFDKKADGFLAELLRLGIPESAITAEIALKTRDRSEPIWDMANRLKSRHKASQGPSWGNPPADPEAERIAREERDRKAREESLARARRTREHMAAILGPDGGPSS
jgi:hypothetical protein